MSFSAIAKLSATAEAPCAAVACSAGQEKSVIDSQHLSQESATFFQITRETMVEPRSKGCVGNEAHHSDNETDFTFDESDVLDKAEVVTRGEESAWAEKITLDVVGATGAAQKVEVDDRSPESVLMGGEGPEAEVAPTLIDGVTSAASSSVAFPLSSAVDVKAATQLSVIGAQTALSSEPFVVKGEQVWGVASRSSKQLNASNGIDGLTRPAVYGTGSLDFSKINSQRLVYQPSESMSLGGAVSQDAEMAINTVGLEARGYKLPLSGASVRGSSGSPANEPSPQSARHVQLAALPVERLAKTNGVLQMESTGRQTPNSSAGVGASEIAQSADTGEAIDSAQLRSEVKVEARSYFAGKPFGALVEVDSAEVVNTPRSGFSGAEFPKMPFNSEGMKLHGGDWTQENYSRGLGADYATIILRKATSRIVQDNTQYLELVLQPKELGKLKFFVSMNESGMTIHVDADRPTTLDALRRHAESFALDLSDDGFANVDFSFGTGGQQDQMRNEQNFDLVVLEVIPEEMAAQPEMPQGAPLGRLDMRI